MKRYPNSIEEALRITQQPVIATDHLGQITFINRTFTDTFGWDQTEITGQPIKVVIPTGLRICNQQHAESDAHTGQCVVTDQPVTLPMISKDDDIQDYQLYIISEERGGRWHFAVIALSSANLT